MANYIEMFHGELLNTPPYLLKKCQEMFLKMNSILEKTYLIKWGLI